MKITMKINSAVLAELQEDEPNSSRFIAQRLDIDRKWGVTGSTFRSFRCVNQPSIKYRKWAEYQFNNLILKSKYNNYVDLHDSLIDSLMRVYWCDAEITLGQYAKLVDLFAIHLISLRETPDSLRDFLVGNANPALDVHTFEGLAVLVPGLVLGSQSMGAVDGRASYWALQGVIEQIAAQANVPKVYFDFWCWPSNRRKDRGMPPVSFFEERRADKATGSQKRAP